MSFDQPTIGEIQMFGANWAPRNYALCQGQLLPISEYTPLFSIIGTFYGGDGRTTFALPDLRGRTPRGQGMGSGLSQVNVGARGGIESESLTALNLPYHTHPHSHTATVHAEARLGDENSPGDNIFALAPNGTNIYHDIDDGRQDIFMHANTVTLTTDATPAGGSIPIGVMNPYLGINYIIALEGIYPSRS